MNCNVEKKVIYDFSPKINGFFSGPKMAFFIIWNFIYGAKMDPPIFEN